MRTISMSDAIKQKRLNNRKSKYSFESLVPGGDGQVYEASSLDDQDRIRLAAYRWARERGYEYKTMKLSNTEIAIFRLK